MSDYDIAHINQQGVDLIIVPLDSSFGYKSPADQRSVINALQRCTQGASLKGTVVPVWDSNGSMAFIAPQEWHPFFQSIDMSYVAMSINRRLTCG